MTVRARAEPTPIPMRPVRSRWPGASRPAWRPLVAALLAALLGAAPPARAASLRIDGFAPPQLDGVATTGADAPDDGLTGFRFAGGRDWPALRYRADVPLDRSMDAALALPIDNAGDEPFTLLLRLDDDPRADGGDRSLTGIVTLAPHAQGAVILPLTAGPGGMRGRPVADGAPQPGDITVTDLRGTVDTRHLVALHISGVRADADRVLRIGAPAWRLRRGGDMQAGPIADVFGQAIAGDWPEKVGSEADLRAKLRAAADETRRLGDSIPTRPRPAAATGFFRVENVDGRWRLVAPDGAPFLSLGVDAVTPSNPTIVAGRRGLFADLPAPGTPLARFFRDDPAYGRTFDIGKADLMRAYGAGWRARWTDGAIRRLAAWGFNTLGNWSEPSLGGHGLATVSFYDVEGASAMLAMPGGRALPDPFDPRYAAVADGVAAAMSDANRDAPALLGYFSGNEMPWGEAERLGEGIAAQVLQRDAASPAKQAFVAGLAARYRDVAAWARAWNIAPPASWQAMLDAPLLLREPLAAATTADLVAFQGRFAERYFATVAQAIRRHDPHHLYLGTRFAAAPPEVIAACARWCDVLSFNVYGASPAAAASRWRPYDRPVLIGEFHFGSLDRGSFWPGMVDAGSEARRGPAYAAYLAAAVKDPAIVGLHWYQYADEPLTGRPYDGENGHIGLVAITDVPYAGFVADVTAANRRALAAFGAAAWTVRGTVP